MLIITQSSTFRPCLADAQLIYEIRIIQKVVKAKYSTLPLLFEYFFVRDDVSGVDFGDDVDAVIDVSHAITCSSYLRSLRFCIEHQALSRIRFFGSGC